MDQDTRRNGKEWGVEGGEAIIREKNLLSIKKKILGSPRAMAKIEILADGFCRGEARG